VESLPEDHGPSRDESDVESRAGAAPLFARLRRETSVLHAEVEEVVPILNASVGVADYLEFLIGLWHWHRPIELRLRHVADLKHALPDLNRRYKAHLLELDLRALGHEVPAPAVLPELPALATLAGALGGLYVVEGSTLGGRHIHRHLMAKIPDSIRAASRFLTCYGPETGRMWTAFECHAERAAQRLDQDEIVAAARATFIAARDCFLRLRSVGDCRPSLP
jgi:heme oxygenase (biliverdin-IX-beta and delta-forming)